MPRTSLQFKKMKDERKLSILEAALPLFSIHGDKVTIDMVSNAAKCSHGLVYHYFKNVDEIFNELLSSDTYQSLINKLFIDDKGRYAYEVIKDIMKELHSLSSYQDMCFANIILSLEGKKSLFDKVTSLVTRGQKEGEVTGGDPREITMCAFLLYKGIYLCHITNKKFKYPNPAFDNVMKIFQKAPYIK